MIDQPSLKRRFLSIHQVAGELNVSDVLVRVLLKSGEMKGFDVGGRGGWRIGFNDVSAFHRWGPTAKLMSGLQTASRRPARPMT